MFVTFEARDTTNVNITFSDGLLSLDADVDGKSYKLENMTLWAEIDAHESKWFRNDRCAEMLLATCSQRPELCFRVLLQGNYHLVEEKVS